MFDAKLLTLGLLETIAEEFEKPYIVIKLTGQLYPRDNK